MVVHVSSLGHLLKTPCMVTVTVAGLVIYQLSAQISLLNHAPSFKPIMLLILMLVHTGALSIFLTLDTGANDHAATNFESLDNSKAYYGNDSLFVGNGQPLPILNIGSTKIYSPNKTLTLSNVLHVPQLKRNFLSVQNFCVDNNVFFEFHASYFVVKDESTRTILLTGPSEHGLYSLRIPQLKSLPKVSFTAYKASSTIWHQRLGHPHAQVFRSIVSHFHLPVLDKLLSSLCTSCQMGKSSKLSLSNSNFHSANILDIVYCDV
ncbi:putative GAG-pre-integrase domain-containing protein [Helianthus annuus]|nr:putative GAG-pre-integrase domain-containing protein [Helianthus annuus]